MSYFDRPPGQRMLREFTIGRDALGHWTAADNQGLVGGVYRKRKDALRFALFEADGDVSLVHAEPEDDSSAIEYRP